MSTKTCDRRTAQRLGAQCGLILLGCVLAIASVPPVLMWASRPGPELGPFGIWEYLKMWAAALSILAGVLAVPIGIGAVLGALRGDISGQIGAALDLAKDILFLAALVTFPILIGYLVITHFGAAIATWVSTYMPYIAPVVGILALAAVLFAGGGALIGRLVARRRG